MATNRYSLPYSELQKPYVHQDWEYIPAQRRYGWVDTFAFVQRQDAIDFWKHIEKRGRIVHRVPSQPVRDLIVRQVGVWE